MFGKEVAPTTGTPHIQGYIYWKNGKTMSASRNLLPKRVGFHEPAKGSYKDNWNYCSKSNNVLTNMERPEDKEANEKAIEQAKWNAMSDSEKDWHDWIFNEREVWRTHMNWKNIIESEIFKSNEKIREADPWECSHSNIIKNMKAYEESSKNIDCEACMAEPTACGAETSDIS